MKKFIIASMLSCFSVAAFADDYQYLTVAYNSQEQSIELATIQKITFDMEQSLVVVTTSEGTVNFPQSEMEKMYFASTPTAVASLPQQSEGLKVSKGVISVTGTGLVHIYASNGALVRMAKVDGAANISLGNLPKGVYIVNLGKQTIKVTK